MNSSRAVATYRKTHVQSSPIRVLDALLRRLLQDLSDAEAAIKARDARQKSELLDHALAILAELDAALDHRRAPALCENLSDLYHFAEERILTASAQMKVEPLAEARSVLDTVHGSFRDATGVR